MEVIVETHQVFNQVPKLTRPNAYLDDPLLQQLLKKIPSFDHKPLSDYGAQYERLEKLGFEANHYLPECKTHDRYGVRQDFLEYHEAYHQLMRLAKQGGIHAYPWTQKPHGHLTRMGLFYLHAQAEAGTACPLSMTYAGIPLLHQNPSLKKTWLP